MSYFANGSFAFNLRLFVSRVGIVSTWSRIIGAGFDSSDVFIVSYLKGESLCLLPTPEFGSNVWMFEAGIWAGSILLGFGSSMVSDRIWKGFSFISWVGFELLLIPYFSENDGSSKELFYD